MSIYTTGQAAATPAQNTQYGAPSMPNTTPTFNGGWNQASAPQYAAPTQGGQQNAAPKEPVNPQLVGAISQSIRVEVAKFNLRPRIERGGLMVGYCDVILHLVLGNQTTPLLRVDGLTIKLRGNGTKPFIGWPEEQGKNGSFYGVAFPKTSSAYEFFKQSIFADQRVIAGVQQAIAEQNAGRLQMSAGAQQAAAASAPAAFHGGYAPAATAPQYGAAPVQHSAVPAWGAPAAAPSPFPGYQAR